MRNLQIWRSTRKFIAGGLVQATMDKPAGEQRNIEGVQWFGGVPPHTVVEESAHASVTNGPVDALGTLLQQH